MDVGDGGESGAMDGDVGVEGRSVEADWMELTTRALSGSRIGRRASCALSLRSSPQLSPHQRHLRDHRNTVPSHRQLLLWRIHRIPTICSMSSMLWLTPCLRRKHRSRRRSHLPRRHRTSTTSSRTLSLLLSAQSRTSRVQALLAQALSRRRVQNAREHQQAMASR